MNGIFGCVFSSVCCSCYGVGLLDVGRIIHGGRPWSNSYQALAAAMDAARADAG